MQKNSDTLTEELEIHVVYSGWHYNPYFGNPYYGDKICLIDLSLSDKLRSIIWNGMKRHKIKSVMVTKIHLFRSNLITKAEMESYCKGEKWMKDSVNDDLESLFENIRLGKEPDERVNTYFLPKLTGEELELVERRGASYLQYVEELSWRRTFVIENLSEISSKTSSETSFENSPEKQSCLKNCCNCFLQ